MTIHLPQAESPAQRLARYRKLSDNATKLAIYAPDIGIAMGYLKLASEWDGLADQARAELEQQSRRVLVTRLWN